MMKTCASRSYDERMEFVTLTQAAVFLAASGMWLGGLLTVPLVALATTRHVAPADRAALFVSFGRTFAVFMGVVLLAALVTSALLVAAGAVVGAAAALALTVALFVVTGVGIAQARAMSLMRRRALTEPGSLDEARLRSNAAAATALRSLIGVLSAAHTVVGVLLVRGLG